jgi:hypothetical protein
MHASAAAASRRSLWAGLDALVLEEIEALRTSPPPLRRPAPVAAPDFASEEEFLMRTLRYLAGHPDPAALVASLSAGFPPAPDPEPKGSAATGEEPVAAPADERTAEPDAIEGNEEEGP